MRHVALGSGNRPTYHHSSSLGGTRSLMEDPPSAEDDEGPNKYRANTSGHASHVYPFAIETQLPKCPTPHA